MSEVDEQSRAAEPTGASAGSTAATAGAGATANGQAASPVTFPCGREGVERLLPHRDPFVWLSRIVACEPGVSITAELDVDPDLDIFRGHFPGHPVLPGVILMEALAQAASCCVLASSDRAGSVGFLTGIDKAKFRQQVLPGDTVTLKATITRNSSRMAVAEVAAYKGDKLCASATQKYVLAKQGQA
jgi:3-hydroxyacyl-[acyl-carrier-protein] dehydratase